MNQSQPVDPTTRFSDRVENYIKYRPSYPLDILSFLKNETSLTKFSIIADVGSGTGILSKLFLKNGNLVYGIEPNLEMRLAAERLMSNFQNFKSIEATAESTSLDKQSVDYVMAGQAFHWFDVNKSRKEFNRILKPDGHVILIWNERLTESSHFLREYENLLCQFGTDYSQINHADVSDEKNVKQFYAPEKCTLEIFPNKQEFDFTGLKGRLLSSSYAPNIGHKNYEPMINELNRIFEQHNKSGIVTIEYKTQVYFGKLLIE